MNYESIQTCNEYKLRCVHNRWNGVYLKTNVALGGVQARVTKRDKGAFGLKKNGVTNVWTAPWRLLVGVYVPLEITLL